MRIGRDCVIDLADGVDGVIELGDGVLLQSRVRLQPWGGAIRIGEHTQVRDGCELKSKGELRVGERVVVRAALEPALPRRRSPSATTSASAIA